MGCDGDGDGADPLRVAPGSCVGSESNLSRQAEPSVEVMDGRQEFRRFDECPPVGGIARAGWELDARLIEARERAVVARIADDARREDQPLVPERLGEDVLRRGERVLA